MITVSSLPVVLAFLISLNCQPGPEDVDLHDPGATLVRLPQLLSPMEQTAAVYICIFLLSLAILYDQVTKRIPTRLRADQAPKSGFGLFSAAENELPARAHGIE